MQVSPYAKQGAGIRDVEVTGGYVAPGLQIVARSAALLHVEPGGVDAPQLRPLRRRAPVLDLHLDVGTRVAGVGRVVEHCPNTDTLSLSHSIAEAGEGRPIVHLAAGAKDVFFIVGAQKIGAGGIPVADMVQQAARQHGPVSVHKTRMISDDPAVKGNLKEQLGSLGHGRVIGTGRQIDWARTHGQYLPSRIIENLNPGVRGHLVNPVMLVLPGDRRGIRKQNKECRKRQACSPHHRLCWQRLLLMISISRIMLLRISKDSEESQRHSWVRKSVFGHGDSFRPSPDRCLEFRLQPARMPCSLKAELQAKNIEKIVAPWLNRGGQESGYSIW